MVKTYNPKKVYCSLGRHIVSGWAEDSMISIEDAGDGTTYAVGADGEVVRSIDPGNVYIMKIAVQQTSPTNEYLHTMVSKDKSDGSGTFSVNITDVLGGDKFTGGIAWVTKEATFQRGKKAENREWEIVVAGGEFH